jgi:opacity protein-like surface antigen
MDSSLPVVQLRESHALALDSAVPPSGGAFTLVIPPYPRMAVGDKVMITWQGFFDGGNEDSPYTNTKNLDAGELARVMIWSLERTYVDFISGGRAQMSYSIAYVSPSDNPVYSLVQTINIVKPSPARLPAIGIENHDGSSIDPELFPEGLTLLANVYTGIQVGDDVLLYAMGRLASTSVVESLRVDQAMIDSGKLSFTVEQKWLRDNLGDAVTLEYQYARPGVAESSERLALDVRASWRPEAPIVVGAQEEAPGPSQGFIEAEGLVRGAVIKVPQEVMLGDNDKVQVHWDGYGTSGHSIVTEPEANDRRTFVIDPAAVPANMGKRLNVFYQVTRPGEAVATSRPFDLRVIAVPPARFRTIQCAQASLGNLPLSQVPVTGADFTLERWMFMAPGQLLTIRAESSTNIYLLENFLITEAHLTAGKVEAKLGLEYLQKLGSGARLTIEVSVSFDEGNSQTAFPSISLTVRD